MEVKRVICWLEQVQKNWLLILDNSDDIVLESPGLMSFIPTSKQQFDAASASEVRKAAQETAAYGASLAETAGFHAQSLTIEAAPTWKGIIEAAQEHHASLIVLGSHRRSGLVGHLLGSVAAAVVVHSPSSVLVVHGQS